MPFTIAQQTVMNEIQGRIYDQGKTWKGAGGLTSRYLDVAVPPWPKAATKVLPVEVSLIQANKRRIRHSCDKIKALH